MSPAGGCTDDASRMPSYLVKRIAALAKVTLYAETVIVALEGAEVFFH